MIPRYTRPEMAAIWAPEHRLRLWLEIELAALEAMAAIGAVPEDAAAKVRAAAERQIAALIDPERIEEIEVVQGTLKKLVIRLPGLSQGKVTEAMQIDAKHSIKPIGATARFRQQIDADLRILLCGMETPPTHGEASISIVWALGTTALGTVLLFFYSGWLLEIAADTLSVWEPLHLL